MKIEAIEKRLALYRPLFNLIMITGFWNAKSKRIDTFRMVLELSIF